MSLRNATPILLVLAFVIGFSSCKNSGPKFTVKGTIEEASDSVLYLYKRNIVGADLVDSAKINKDGTFQMKVSAPSFSELYVLALGKQMINLAVDSIETITINAKKTDFATGYTVEGSTQTELIRQLYLKQLEVSKTLKELKSQFDRKEIADSVYLQKAREATNAYRNLAQDIIVKNLQEISAYYALFQKIDGYVVFDPFNKSDSRFFSAVATAWDTYKPESPRTEHLKKYTLNAIGKRRAAEGTSSSILEKASVGSGEDYFNISLPGIDDKKLDLSSLKGKVVLLDFSMYQSENSPAHNIALNKVYEKYKNSDFTIYQVSFGTPLHFWKTSANNLPWITVREDNTNSELLARFNIQNLPTTFLLNKRGEIVSRISSYNSLSSEIEKLL